MKRDNTRVIRDIPEFSDLPDNVVNALIGVAQTVRYPKGAVFHQSGEKCNWIGFIVKGLVRGYQFMNNREENVWGLFKEGDFFSCPHAFVNPAKSINNFQALEELELLILPLKPFDSVCVENPTLKIRTYQTVTRLLLHQMEEKSRLLNMTASERYEYFLQQYPDMIFRVPLGQISSFLGIRQSSLSRIRRQMSEGKVLQH